eukprot:7092137-Pyramimonas_sp.AAC.1
MHQALYALAQAGVEHRDQPPLPSGPPPAAAAAEGAAAATAVGGGATAPTPGVLFGPAAGKPPPKASPHCSHPASAI